tara:strand:- start:299 stop:517 length:219 start_codon:yes stop_codon:yes gene_type:complete
MMALPKSNGPGALTRKTFGYTAPSHEQLIEEMEYIAEEMGGNISELFTSNSVGRTSRKIVIEYDIKEKNDSK